LEYVREAGAACPALMQHSDDLPAAAWCKQLAEMDKSTEFSIASTKLEGQTKRRFKAQFHGIY